VAGRRSRPLRRRDRLGRVQVDDRFVAAVPQGRQDVVHGVVEPFTDRVDLGMLDPRLALEMSRQLVDFGFQDLALHRISAAIGPDNETSIAVARRLGMKYEGRLRDHVFTNGAWRDSLLYAILSTDRTVPSR
jgi:hypothetical protein